MISSAVWPLVPGSGRPGRGAGGRVATPTTPAPARPGPAEPTPLSAAAPAPRAPSAGSAAAPFCPPADPLGPVPNRGEHGQGEQAQRDVAVPPGPTADLVLVQPALALGPLEPLLDSPPRPGHPDQL